MVRPLSRQSKMAPGGTADSPKAARKQTLMVTTMIMVVMMVLAERKALG